MNQIKFEYQYLWQTGLFLVVCLLLMIIGRVLYKLFNPKTDVDDLLVEKDNTAFAIPYVGYFAGVLFTIGGVINSEGSGEFWNELLLTGVYGIVAIVLLIVSGIILDKAVLTKMNLTHQIQTEENMSAGIIRAANYVSTGILLMGVLLVDINKPWEGMVFLGIALVLALLATKVYDLFTPFKLQTQIKEGNIPVAIATAGTQLAFAILISSGIQVEHYTWDQSIIYILIDVLAGIAIIPVVRLIIDKIFLPKRKLTDEIIHQEVPNVGAGIIEGFGYIAGAVLFIWCWNL